MTVSEGLKPPTRWIWIFTSFSSLRKSLKSRSGIEYLDMRSLSPEKACCYIQSPLPAVVGKPLEFSAKISSTRFSSKNSRSRTAESKRSKIFPYIWVFFVATCWYINGVSELCYRCHWQLIPASDGHRTSRPATCREWISRHSLTNWMCQGLKVRRWG